jgi:hypothetical protein
MNIRIILSSTVFACCPGRSPLPRRARRRRRIITTTLTGRISQVCEKSHRLGARLCWARRVSRVKLEDGTRRQQTGEEWERGRGGSTAGERRGEAWRGGGHGRGKGSRAGGDSQSELKLGPALSNLKSVSRGWPGAGRGVEILRRTQCRVVLALRCAWSGLSCSRIIQAGDSAVNLRDAVRTQGANT